MNERLQKNGEKLKRFLPRESCLISNAIDRHPNDCWLIWSLLTMRLTDTLSISWQFSAGGYLYCNHQTDEAIWDSQPDKFQLSLSHENIFHHPTGYEYQIYYEGRAIGKEKMKWVMQKASKETESGWIICSLNDDCNFTESKIEQNVRWQSNVNSLQHVRKAFSTLLCRYCFRTSERTDTSCSQLRTHPICSL